ncbi:MAG: hypothetical protein RBG13Loki_2582 [Promethearchaeota archaeon CR_4]|nr:MAG: hypothetical protein RBG13Loki_2582 [Candidatus Lokiarchaeota archaeon CR_4]
MYEIHHFRRSESKMLYVWAKTRRSGFNFGECVRTVLAEINRELERIERPIREKIQALKDKLPIISEALKKNGSLGLSIEAIKKEMKTFREKIPYIDDLFKLGQNKAETIGMVLERLNHSLQIVDFTSFPDDLLTPIITKDEHKKLKEILFYIGI